MVAGLKRARARMSEFGATMQRAGAVALSVGGAALGGLGVGAIASLNKTAELSATAKAFGLTAQEASRTFGIMASGGSDIRDATEGLVTFGQRVEEALAGKGEVAAELFKGLNVGAEQFAGLNPAEQFDKVMAAIRRVQDPAARINLLFKAFGEDTGKNLLTLLAKTPAELDRLGKSFELSADDMAKAESASTAYHTAVSALEGVWTKVGVALAPVITVVADLVTKAAVAVADFVGKNQELVIGAVAVAAAVAAGGAAFLAIGTGLSVASVALAGIMSPLGQVVIGTAAVAAVVGGLGYLFATQTELGQQAVTALGGAFDEVLAYIKPTLDEIWSVVSSTWQGIVDAVSAGDLQLAGQIAMAGLDVAWKSGLHGLQIVWTEFKAFFVDGFHDAVMLVEVAFEDLTSSIAKMLVGLVENLTGSLGDQLSSMLGLDAVRDNLKGVMNEIDADNQRQRNKIITQAQADQAKRDADRAKALAATEEAVGAARGVLDDLVQEAADLAAEVNKNKPDPVKNKIKELSFSANKVVGQFLGGANAAQVFGQGTNDVDKKQLKVQEDLRDAQKVTNEKLEDVVRAVRDSAPMFC